MVNKRLQGVLNYTPNKHYIIIITYMMIIMHTHVYTKEKIKGCPLSLGSMITFTRVHDVIIYHNIVNHNPHQSSFRIPEKGLSGVRQCQVMSRINSDEMSLVLV